MDIVVRDTVFTMPKQRLDCGFRIAKLARHATVLSGRPHITSYQAANLGRLGSDKEEERRWRPPASFLRSRFPRRPAFASR